MKFSTKEKCLHKLTLCCDFFLLTYVRNVIGFCSLSVLAYVSFAHDIFFLVNYLFSPTNILSYSNLQEDRACLGERKETPLSAFSA